MLIVWIPQGQLKRAEVERQVSKEEIYTALSLKYYSWGFFLLLYPVSLFFYTETFLKLKALSLHNPHT